MVRYIGCQRKITLGGDLMLKRALRPWAQLIIALLIMAIGTILDGMVMVKMMGFVDYALAGDLETLKAQMPLFLLQVCLLVPIQLLATITAAWFRMDSNLSMKRYYIRKVFQKNISAFQKENTANYISRLTNDCNTLDTNFVEGIFTISVGITNLAVALWILSTVGSAMLVLVLVVGTITCVVSVLLSRSLQKQTKERSDMFDGYTSYIKEVLSAFHIVKCNHLQQKVTDDYSGKSEQIQDKWYTIQKVMTYIITLQNGAFSSVLYLTLVYLAYLGTKGLITASQALIVTQGMQRILWPVMMMSEAMPNLVSSKKLGQKINDSLINCNQHEETLDFDSFEDKIELIDAGFAYEDSESDALTLHDVTTGKILIDGKELSDIKKEDFFSKIANVEQQVFIFEDTLRNNITLYKDYAEEEVLAAIRAAGLERFVYELPDGLETMIYENGKNISGGERSRVVIARAFLAKTSILHMDEAFAALDLERAKEIEETILNLDDMTVINVSHVIFKDTLKQYDQVFHVKGTVW